MDVYEYVLMFIVGIIANLIANVFIVKPLTERMERKYESNPDKYYKGIDGKWYKKDW